MATNEWDGHLNAEDMENPRYFLYLNIRVVVEAQDPWYERMKWLGAVEVSQDEYQRADALRIEGRSE